MGHKFKGDIQVDGSVKLPNENTEEVIVIDSSNNLLASGISTSDLQTVVDDAILQDGSKAMEADLDMGSNKITNVTDPTNDQDAATKKYIDDEIAALPSTFNIQGNWNANTNTPSLSSGVNPIAPDQYPLYIVSVAGNTTLDGYTDWVVGDKLYFANGQWYKADNNDAVTSVNSQTGVVSLDADDIDDAATTNKFATQTELDQISTNTSDISDNASDITNLQSDKADKTTTINTTAPLAGGGDLSANRTFSLDSQTLTSVTPELNDEIIISDQSDTFANKRATVQDIVDLASSPVTSVNTQTGDVVLDTDDITEANNLYFTDERAQDATGAMAANGEGIDLTYDDATPSFTADLNFPGLDAEASTENADLIAVWDDSASKHVKVTKSQFLAGSGGSPEDIKQTSFTAANNQSSAADVTGFAFANADVRSFKAWVSVTRDATADVYEAFEIQGIQKGASWDIAVQSVGDDSGITFSITNSGQMQYTSSDLAGHVSSIMKFRAITTEV